MQLNLRMKWVSAIVVAESRGYETYGQKTQFVVRIWQISLLNSVPIYISERIGHHYRSFKWGTSVSDCNELLSDAGRSKFMKLQERLREERRVEYHQSIKGVI